MKCLACESASLVEGALIDSNGSQINFTISDSGLLGRIFGRASRPMLAFGCTNCGHIQFVAQFTDEDREKYISFEGEHRSIVDPT